MIALERIERSFVIQNEVTCETAIHKVKIQVDGKTCNIFPAVSQVVNYPSMLFKVYDFQVNRYVDLDEIVINETNNKTVVQIPAKFVKSDIVPMKYSICSTKQETESVHKSEASSMKKERSKERTIAQVIDIVKQWRELHLNPKNKKRLNLQQAAQVIGISKKSLDDYYYQLRLGQKYGFDFRGHLLDRIGILRTFIKQKKLEYKDAGKKQKIGKHPKQLKIIEELTEIDLMLYRKSNTAHMSSQMSSESGMDIEQSMKNTEGYMNQNSAMQEDKKSVKSIEDQFYNDFEFLLEDPQDPFLNLGGDFKRKGIEEVNQNFFF